MKSNIQGIVIAVASLSAVVAQAAEYPIGVPEQRFGMEIGAVYLQPVRMEPAGMMRPADKSDVHLEADIHALDSNPNGFAEGDWIPYLQVDYEVTRQGNQQVIKGKFMPMTADDGPHYGDNVKLMGPGRYHVKYTIYPPNAPENPDGHHFGRHTDRLTGVRPWFPTFSVDYDFIFAGIGKKGGY
jgi:hypothetical protein